MGAGGLNRWLGALEQAQRDLGTTDNNLDYYRFRMCATSPPSTSVIVQGGQRWSESVGNLNLSTGGTFDMLTFTNVRGQSLPFTIPYGYTYLWVAWSWNEGLTSGGAGSATDYAWFEEFDTAIEAETAAMETNLKQLNYYSSAGYGAFCGCLILRNNGDVSKPGQIQAIDQVNRGRSYIWRNRQSTATRNVA